MPTIHAAGFSSFTSLLPGFDSLCPDPPNQLFLLLIFCSGDAACAGEPPGTPNEACGAGRLLYGELGWLEYALPGLDPTGDVVVDDGVPPIGLL